VEHEGRFRFFLVDTGTRVGRSCGNVSLLLDMDADAEVASILCEGDWQPGAIL